MNFFIGSLAQREQAGARKLKCAVIAVSLFLPCHFLGAKPFTKNLASLELASDFRPTPKDLPKLGNKWEKHADKLNEELASEALAQSHDSRYHTGLRNRGNTCFLNGAMHLLAADAQFLTFLSRPYNKGSKRTVPVLRGTKRLHEHLHHFFTSLRNSQHIKDPSRHFIRVNHALKKVVRDYIKLHNLYFTIKTEPIPGTQQDPQEFLQKLFELLGYQEQYGFSLADTLQWDYDLTPRLISEVQHSILSLPIIADNGTPFTSVQEAIDDFFKRNPLEGSASNNFAQGFKQTHLREAPKSLLIQLKRYHYNFETLLSERAQHSVDVRPFFVDLFHSDGRLSKRATYSPQAVEVHQSFPGGGLDAGHYYTYVRHPKGWVAHNDAKRPKLSQRATEDIDTNAYLVLYKLTALSDVSQPPN